MEVNYILVLIGVLLMYLPQDIQQHKYTRCRKKKKYKKGCDNFMCLTAHICPYSKYYIFDDWSVDNEENNKN